MDDWTRGALEDLRGVLSSSEGSEDDNLDDSRVSRADTVVNFRSKRVRPDEGHFDERSDEDELSDDVSDEAGMFSLLGACTR